MHDGQKIDSFIGIEYNDDHEKTEPTNLNPFSKSNISEVNLLNCNNAKVFQSEVQTTENSLEVFAPRKQDDPNLKNDNDPQQPSTNTDGDKKASPSIKIEDSSELSKLVEVNTNDNPENELTDSIKIFGTTCNSPSLPNKVTKSFDHSEFAFSVNTKNTAVRTEIEIIVLSDSNDDASEEIELNQSIVAQDKLNVSIKDEKSLNDTRSSSSGNNTETAEKISPSPLRQEILNQEISIQENKEKSFELASSEFSGQAATLSLLSSQLTASTIPPISAISPPSLLPYPLTQSHISLPSSSPPPLTAWLPSLHVLSPPSSSSPPSSFPSPPSPIDTDNPVNIDNLAVSDIDTSFDSISTELFGQAPALQHSISQTIASPLQTPQQISFSSSSPLPLSPSLPSLLTLASPPPPPMDTDNLLDSSHVLDEPDLDCIPMSAEQLSEIEFYSLNNAMTSESLELFHHDDFDDRVTVLLDNNVNNNNNNDATFNVPDNNDLETTKNINETNRNASNICESYDYGSNPFNGISSVSTNPSIINRVDNLGYSHNNDIVIYYCLVETCTSTFLCSDLSVRLKSHLTEEHAQICWKGYCHTCIAQVSCNRNLTLDNELQHIVDYHIKSKAIRLPKSATKKPEEKSNNIVDSPSTCSLNSDTTTADNQSQGSNVAGKALNDANKILHDQPKKIFTATPLSMPQQTQQTRPPLNKPFCLKPWTETKSKKSQQNSLKLLHRVCLFSLYKCMGDECAFTTNNAIIMTEHLKNHISQAEESGVLFHGYSSFLECAYCSAQSTTIHQLVSHITAVHSQDIYQCPYCFYRACCGYYIITHLQQFHPADVEYVLVCFGEKQVPNLIKICNSRRQFVKSIECFDCKEKFFILRNFENHIKTVHQKELSFTCALCSVLVHKNNALHHYSQIHNISKLQCVYCIFGGSTVDYMRKHMANMHSSALPYVTLREPDEDILLTDTELLDTATQIICIADTVDPNVFRSCPYYPRQLNLMSPTLKDATHTNDPVIQKSNDVQFTHIQSTINVQMPQTIISIKDVNLTGLSSVLPADTQFFPNTISSKSKVVPSSVSSTIVSSAIVQQPRNLNIGERTSIINKSTISMTQQETPTLQPEITILTSMCQTTETMINENPLTTKELYLKIEQAACEIVSGTGLVGHKLYRCGFSECSEQLPDIDKFSEHILCHLADTKIPINCYHCKVNFKTLIDFKIHLEIHSVHRYFCFWCKFTGSIVITLTQHISDSHSVNNVITYPLISGKDDENLHYFIIGPKSVEKEQMSGFYDKLLRLWKHKKSLMKIHYTPDEIDTLPQQDIFLKELFCSVCQYSTKVRRNIYQHLERHLAQVNITTNHVPDTDNINTSLSSIRNPLIEKSEPKNKTIWECSICRHRTDTDSQISAHMEQMHQIQHKYQCSNCPFTSAIIEDLVMHTSANHPNQVPEVRIKFYEVKDSPSLNDADETFRDNDFIIISDDDSASVVDLCEESATDNDIEILTEFQLEHDQTVIPTVVSENKSPSHVIDYKKAQLSLEQFNKYIKYICYYCPDVLYDDLKMVINHHETAHKTLNEHTALRFKIKKIFKCSLCLYTDIYQNVFQHYKAEHSGLPIITRDAFDDFKCGLCSLQTCDPGKLCEHYLSDHSETQRNENKEPTNYITDEFLNDLLFHTDGFGEEFFCEICLNIFKNMQVYSEHHKNKHGRKVKSWSKPCIRYACLICPAKIYINRPNILKHITCKHSLKYLGNQDKGLHATSISTNLDNDIDLIFPNGFTLKTCEAKFTKYYIWKKQASDENKRQSSRKSSSIKRYVGETSSSGNKKATGTTIKPVKKIPKK